MSNDVRVRYGAGGVPYVEKTIETEKQELEASLKQSKAAKAERIEKEKKKKKKKVIQEIMGDDLNEEKEMLDEII
jgi:cbb3-type cytochrome oxidase cytochrome c subunit